MKYLLKAITTNNRDLKTALLLSIEETSYLFNCPDGFQRLALNQRMKFNKVRYIFLSGIHPDYYAGFPGFYLSAKEAQGADLKNYKLGVMGPHNLHKLIKQGRQFFSGLASLDIHEYGKLTKPYNDRASREMRIFKNQQKKQGIKFDKSMKEEEKVHEPSSIINDHIFSDNYLTVIPVGLESSHATEPSCYSFICIPKQAKGKFLPKVAVELGCNARLHFKILSDGQQVTLEDGSIVYPFQVMEEPLPAQSMIFVFMPNDGYINALKNPVHLQHFERMFATNIDSKSHQLRVIYHSIPLQVLLNENYRDFMMNFGSEVNHIIDCHETNDEVLAKTKGFSLSQRHSAVCPALLPLSPIAIRNFELESKETLKAWLQDIKYVNSKVGLVYELYPATNQGVDMSQVISNADIFSSIQEELLMELRNVSAKMQEIKGKEFPDINFAELANTVQPIDASEPVILFLGTVSMKPTMYRSASAIYVFIKGLGILMDCAEGSYGQLYDHFQTLEKVNDAILKMKVVFLTHIHGDHQLGIIKIMVERDRLLKGFDQNDKLYIVTPEPMFDYMELYRTTVLRHPDMVVLVRSDDLNPEPSLYYGDELDPEYLKRPKCPERSLDEVNTLIANHSFKTTEAKELHECLAYHFNIKHMVAVETDHCVESYGCLLDSPDFGRIFYSGDTRPCQTVMNYCQKITLLIHEATFEDSLADDANYKRHTTMGQAMDIGVKCGVWRTCLTHFSPRYQKIAEITEQNMTTKTMVSFDHLRIKLSQFEWAYHMLDIYSKLFTNDDVDPQTAEKKQQNREEIKQNIENKAASNNANKRKK